MGDMTLDLTPRGAASIEALVNGPIQTTLVGRMTMWRAFNPKLHLGCQVQSHIAHAHTLLLKYVRGTKRCLERNQYL